MKRETDHTYTLIITAHNSPGVLVRCAQIFNRRGHNIESLHVSPIAGSNESRMTITAFGKRETIHQITMQLQKLIDITAITEG
jgi:acetolactate synthase small subunit